MKMYQKKALKKKISENLRLKVVLKSVYLCGSKVPKINSVSAVAVVKNKKQAKFMGVSSCKSPWCCPVCTARKMAKYAAKISCALDALKRKGFKAAMFTFTIPHTADFSCEESTEILYAAWKAFTVHGNKILKASRNDIFAKFAESTNHSHRVRVAEYTHGEKGWHPHFHCLFWFPADKFDKVLDWEEKLNQRWLELTKRYTIRILARRPEYTKKNSSCVGTSQTNSSVVVDNVPTIQDGFSKLVTRVEIMYNNLNKGSNGLWISKTKEGSIIEQNSSNYLCGWGGDKEITGNVTEKATHAGHKTWQQILDAAIAGDEKSWSLFFEYATATRKYRHTRVNFSVHSGLCQIIAEYQNSEGYKIYLKKKNTEYRQEVGIWKTVCFFNMSQWLCICERDLEPEILRLAMLEDGFGEINKLLERHGLGTAVQNEAQAAKLEAMLNVA